MVQDFVDKKHYGDKSIAYVGYYLEKDSKLMTMTEKELLKHVLPHLENIEDGKFKVLNTYDFKGPFAQPIFSKTFIENMPTFRSPVKNLYVANLDMTFPYDRGTNFAVKLGREVAGVVDGDGAD